jgi:hypothetical protein
VWRLLAFTLVGLSVGAARADNPTARLTYSRGPGAGTCPDESELLAAVAGRLGYDPFRADARVGLTATISRQGRGLRAEIEMQDENGRATGARSLTSQQHDCGELATAMALAISIAIDPLSIARTPSPQTPAPAICPACPPPPPPPPPPARERIHPRLSVGVLGAAGSAPNLALGFTLGVGLRYRAFSLALEGRFDAPFSINVNTGGAMRSSLLVAVLVPCAHWRWFAGCALVAAGAMVGEGIDVTAPNRAVTPYAAAGWRVAAELQLQRLLWVRIHLDLYATLTRTTLQLNGVEAWTTPPLHGALGVAFFANFR